MRQIALPLAVVSYLLLAMVVPSLRTWRRAGINPLVFGRQANPVQRLLGSMMALALVGLAAWATLYGVLGPAPLGVWSAPPALAAAGWSMVGAGLLLVSLAQLQMGVAWRVGIDDRPTPLVTSGLFTMVRNPIFCGMLLSLAGLAAVSPCAWTVMGLLWFGGLIMLQVRLEEAHLLRLHGAKYAAYARRVGRFLPAVGRLTGEAR